MNESDMHVRELAALARLRVGDTELAALEQELPKIVDFVRVIQEAGGKPEKGAGEHRNVMRDDANPHDTGAYTEDLLEGAPNRSDNYIAVQRVITKGEDA